MVEDTIRLSHSASEVDEAVDRALPNGEIDTLLLGKVDSETGKGLSSNDYTDAEKELVGTIDGKMQKYRIDYDGENFTHGETILTYKDIHDALLINPDFVYIVYGDRSHLPSFINDDETIKEIRFSSTIISGGLTKTQSFYITSTDGGNTIANVQIVNINNENVSNKVASIGEGSNVYYPTTKAVKEYVDSVADTKADKTALDRTDRSLEMLWKLNEGISYTKEESVSTDYEKTIPTGAIGFVLNEVGGMSRKAKNSFRLTGSQIVSGITNNGITIKQNEDGTYSVNGTAAGDVQINIFNQPNAIRTGQVFAVKALSGTYQSTTARCIMYISNYANGIICYVNSHQTATSNFESLVIFRFSASAGDVFNNLNLGISITDEVTEWEPYFDGLKSAQVNKAIIAPTTKNFLNPVNIVRNKILNDSGVEISDVGGFYIKPYFPIIANTPVSVSAKPVTGSGTHRLYVFDAEGNLLSRNVITLTNLSDGRRGYTHTTFPNNAKFFSLQGVAETAFTDYQIEYGSISSYSPYTQTELPVSTEGLHGIDAATYDKKDYTEGKLYRNLRYRPMTDFAWVAVTSIVGGFYYEGNFTIDYKFTQNCKALSSHYKYVGTNRGGVSLLSDGEFCLYYNSQGANFRGIYVRDTSCATLADFLAKIADAYVLYELATPVITDLADEDIFDNTVICEANGTITFEQDDVIKIPVPNKETFVVKVSEVV